MRVAYLTVEIHFFDPQSLKAKRSLLMKIREAVRRRFNVSVAEVGYHDKWQRTALGFAFLSAHADSAREETESILKFIKSRLPSGEITGHDLDCH